MPETPNRWRPSFGDLLGIVAILIGVAVFVVHPDWQISIFLVLLAIALVIFAAMRHAGHPAVRGVVAAVAIGVFVFFVGPPIWGDFTRGTVGDTTATAVLAPDAPTWLKIAYKELGQAEIPGPQENPRIVEYFKTISATKNYRDDVNDWASAFAEWSLNKAGINGPKSDDPFAWLFWGEPLTKPRLGCIAVLSFSGLRHVGFYFDENGDSVRILGGNEGDAVRIFRYPKSAIVGYRWPSAQRQ